MQLTIRIVAGKVNCVAKAAPLRFASDSNEGEQQNALTVGRNPRLRHAPYGVTVMLFGIRDVHRKESVLIDALDIWEFH